MYCENVKGNGKIIHHYKLLEKLYSPICIYIVVSLLTILTNTQIEQTRKPTCLFNAGFCHPTSIPSLMLKKHCLVACSIIEKESLLLKALHPGDSFKCMYTCNFLSVSKCSLILVEKCRFVLLMQSALQLTETNL